MTTLCVVFDDPVEGVTVIRPSQKARLEGEDEVDFLRRVVARNIETAKQINSLGKVVNPNLTEKTTFKIVAASEVPKDRADRAAWFRTLA